MDWTFRINERNKVAITFLGLTVLIILSNWAISHYITKISHNFQSIYYDRLIPAMDISTVMEKFYQNRLYLKEHINTDKKIEQLIVEKKINHNHLKINLLIKKFEKTYLVEAENINLNDYRKKLEQHKNIERDIIRLSHDGLKKQADKLFIQDNNQSFELTLNAIHQLMAIQEKVGKELFNSAKKQSSEINMLIKLLFALVVIIALMATALIKATMIIKSAYENNPTQRKKFHLN